MSEEIPTKVTLDDGTTIVFTSYDFIPFGNMTLSELNAWARSVGSL